jgi:hypothetical protein
MLIRFDIKRVLCLFDCFAKNSLLISQANDARRIQQTAAALLRKQVFFNLIVAFFALIRESRLNARLKES